MWFDKKNPYLFIQKGYIDHLSIVQSTRGVRILIGLSIAFFFFFFFLLIYICCIFCLFIILLFYLVLLLLIYDIRDGILKSLGIYLTIQRYIQEIYIL